MFRKAVVVGVLSLSLAGQPARAEPLREFIMSCTYGALAGTLVGAASLAFTDKPGDNLNNIARGASLGLYAGILLGLYVVYGVTSDEEKAVQSATQSRLWLQPVHNERSELAGAVANIRVWQF